MTWHLGRWIRTTDWYPDYQLRLYDRRRARWNDRRVHESVERRRRRSASCASDLQHYAYRDISHHHQTMDRYTTLAAEEMFARRPARRRRSISRCIRRRRSCATTCCARGFRDGAPGFIISAMNAHYVFLKFAKLWALRSDRGRD